MAATEELGIFSVKSAGTVAVFMPWAQAVPVHVGIAEKHARFTIVSNRTW